MNPFQAENENKTLVQKVSVLPNEDYSALSIWEKFAQVFWKEVVTKLSNLGFRWTESKVKQEEGKARLEDINAEITLQNANAEYELKKAQAEKLRAEVAEINENVRTKKIRNELAEKVLGPQNATAEEIISRITSAIGAIEMKGGVVSARIANDLSVIQEAAQALDNEDDEPRVEDARVG